LLCKCVRFNRLRENADAATHVPGAEFPKFRQDKNSSPAKNICMTKTQGGEYMYGEQEFMWRAFAVTGDPLAYLEYRRGNNDFPENRRPKDKKSIG